MKPSAHASRDRQANKRLGTLPTFLRAGARLNQRCRPLFCSGVKPSAYSVLRAGFHYHPNFTADRVAVSLRGPRAMRLLVIDNNPSEWAPLMGHPLATDRPLNGTCRMSCDRCRIAAQGYELRLVELASLDPGTQARLDARFACGHVPVIALVPKDALPENRRHQASQPVAMPKLMARVQGILDRSGAVPARTFRAAGLAVSPATGHASFDGRLLVLSARELAALARLVRYAPHPVPRQTLEASVYGTGAGVTSNAIEAVLSRLRRTLKDAGCPARIVALRGMGWLLKSPERDEGQGR